MATVVAGLALVDVAWPSDLAGSSTSGATSSGTQATASTGTGGSGSSGSTVTAQAEATASADPTIRLTVTPSYLGLTSLVNVAAVDLTDGDAIVAGESLFDTASIVKVDILAALLWQNDGVLTSSQRSLARSMITESDNSAAVTLFAAVGGRTGLTEANTAFGLTETTVGSSGYWGLTQTTVSDQIALLRQVFTDDSVLSASSRAYVQDLMEDVIDEQRWGVTTAADDEDEAYVKNGWLARSTTGLWDVNSIGSVEADGHTYLVAALSKGSTSLSGGVDLVEEAVDAAVAALDP